MTRERLLECHLLRVAPTQRVARVGRDPLQQFIAELEEDVGRTPPQTSIP